MSNEFEGSYHSLIIGFIPANNRSEYISTGDPDGSGTKEIYLQFHDDSVHVSSGKKSFEIPYGRRRIWNEESTIWKEIATCAVKELKTGKYKLSSRRLARCFLIPQGESDSYAGVLHVARPNNCGEFVNEDGAHSGKYYVKYEFVDNDEYEDENVYVIQ
jgi:hypothetical protein